MHTIPQAPTADYEEVPPTADYENSEVHTIPPTANYENFQPRALPLEIRRCSAYETVNGQ